MFDKEAVVVVVAPANDEYMDALGLRSPLANIFRVLKLLQPLDSELLPPSPFLGSKRHFKATRCNISVSIGAFGIDQ